MTLDVTRSAGVVTLTLDRPQTKNALNEAMYLDLLAAAKEIAARPAEDRVVIVTGAGGAFCSGADLSDPTGADTAFLTRMRLVGDVCLALHHLPQPTVAKVEGAAVGAGLGLALSCDLVIASETARFHATFARLALSADFGVSWVLPRLVGPQRAKELVLLAEELDARGAREIGVVSRVVAPERLDDEVADVAQRLASGPPVALSLSKRLLNQAFGVSLPEALEAEAQAQAVNFATKDVREAMRARLEGRSPVFLGR